MLYYENSSYGHLYSNFSPRSNPVRVWANSPGPLLSSLVWKQIPSIPVCLWPNLDFSGVSFFTIVSLTWLSSLLLSLAVCLTRGGHWTLSSSFSQLLLMAFTNAQCTNNSPVCAFIIAQKNSQLWDLLWSLSPPLCSALLFPSFSLNLASPLPAVSWVSEHLEVWPMPMLLWPMLLGSSYTDAQERTKQFLSSLDI